MLSTWNIHNKTTLCTRAYLEIWLENSFTTHLQFCKRVVNNITHYWLVIATHSPYIQPQTYVHFTLYYHRARSPVEAPEDDVPEDLTPLSTLLAGNAGNTEEEGEKGAETGAGGTGARAKNYYLERRMKGMLDLPPLHIIQLSICTDHVNWWNDDMVNEHHIFACLCIIDLRGDARMHNLRIFRRHGRIPRTAQSCWTMHGVINWIGLTCIYRDKSDPVFNEASIYVSYVRHGYTYIYRVICIRIWIYIYIYIRSFVYFVYLYTYI